GLIKQMKSPDPELRRAAAKALGDAGADAKPAVLTLAEGLKDSDKFVRRFSAQALGNLGADAKAAVPFLKAALNDDKAEVADAALTALGKIGLPALEVLSDVAKDKKADLGMRVHATETIIALKPDASVLVPILTEQLGEKGDQKNMELRLDAAKGL